MSKAKKANEGVVTAIGDADLVMVSGANGSWHPISFANLMAAVRNRIQIGGRNLLKRSYNGGTGWNKAATNGVFEITATTSSETFLNGPKIPLEIGKTYTVSLTAKATSNMQSMDVWLSATTNGVMKSSIKVSEEWKHYSYSIVIKEIHAIAGSFRIDNNGSSNGQAATLWVKDIKVEEGNIATAWSPAPEDVASGLWGG